MALSKVKVWLLASRPKTLWASAAPVLIGTSMALSDNFLHVPSALFALIGAVMIQVGANFANDYFDFIHGADTAERLGPVRATQAGLVKPEAMKRAFLIAFLTAFAAGVYLILRGGLPILMIGIFSIFFGILYTGGPHPLGYYGLGDVFVFIFFGPVAVAGTYYVQALEINTTVIVAGIAPGLISVAILTVNNLRDIDTDRQSGKKTLAVRFGATYTRIQYCFSLALACFVPVALFFLSGNHIYSLASAGALAFVLPAVKAVFQKQAGAALNKVLADTGIFLIIFSIVFSAGWLM